MSENPIYREIADERQRQDAEYGGPKHDDTHTNVDWIGFLNKHLAKAWTTDRTRWRRQMIILAALAVAAIEWGDRRHE